MHFGQFFTSTARQDRRCEHAKCITEIQPGEDYFGLIIRRKDSKPFMQAFHRQCFIEGIDLLVDHRKELIKEKRKAPRPYRVLRLEPALAARKKTLVHKLSVTKAQLMLGYLNANSKNITRNKTTLVKILTELNQPEFERPYHWHFGDNLIKQLAAGVDPLISGEAAKKADRKDFTEAIRLLSLEADQPVSVDYEANADLGEIRKNLLAALKNKSGEKKALLALASSLDPAQPVFDFGAALEERIATRTDLFTDPGSMPSTWTEFTSAMKSNKALGEYLRTVAGRME